MYAKAAQQTTMTTSVIRAPSLVFSVEFSRGAFTQGALVDEKVDAASVAGHVVSDLEGFGAVLRTAGVVAPTLPVPEEQLGGLG